MYQKMRYNRYMTQEYPLFSIIIPAYNEEKRIGKTLDAIQRYLVKKRYSAEVIVADGGSKDQTVRVVEDQAKSFPGLRVIVDIKGFGKGSVVRRGMVEAKGVLRLFTDADNATPIEELEKLLPYIKKPQGLGGGSSLAEAATAREGGGEYDVVIASIGLKESRVERAESGIRSLAGKLSNLLVQTVVLPGIWDTQRGFKLFTAEAAEKIFPLGKIDRWGFDVEVLALARRFGFRIREVPVRWIHDPDSRVGMGAYFNTLWDLARIRFWLWTNAYKVKRRSEK